MDHTRIDDDQVPERYVQGRLPEENRQSFEEHLIGCTRCLDAVEAVEGLRDALKDTSAGADLAPSGAGSHSVRVGPWRARPFVTLLAAACVPLAVLSALFSAQAGRARREAEGARQALAQTQHRQAELEGALERERADRSRPESSAALRAPLAAPVFMLHLTRGAQDREPENRILLPDPPGWVTLVFDRPETRDLQSFGVRVTTADGKPIGDAAAAAATSGDWLAVSLSADRLQPSDYVLHVEGSEPGKSLATYRFRAERKP